MAPEDEKMQAMAAETGTLRPGQDACALDVWLHRALAARFNATLDEALPAELTALLSVPH